MIKLFDNVVPKRKFNLLKSNIYFRNNFKGKKLHIELQKQFVSCNKKHFNQQFGYQIRRTDRADASKAQDNKFTKQI